MTKVAILPISTATGDIAYHAIAGDKQAHGKAAGAALYALAAQLPEQETGTFVIVQSFRPDSFFGVDQQRRRAELMARWRAARDAGITLAAPEQMELDTLIEEEIRASVKRTAALLHNLG
jgi:hypothetical protein